MKADKGLYDKFSVTRNLNGEKVHGTFVLMPEKDPAAVAALATYADEVRKEAPELASDIHDWLEHIILGKMTLHPTINEWAKDFFNKGMRSTTNGSGQDLVLIEAGPGRGKTTLGIIAGIKYWERHATYPPSTGMGFIVTNNSIAPGSGFLHAQHLCDVLVNEFHAVVTCRHENIVSIPTKIGSCTIRVCAIDSPVLEVIHMHADWMFVDNIDLMRPQNKVWRTVDRFDPKMLILSQNVHTFASAILANKNEWNVLTDPTLL